MGHPDLLQVGLIKSQALGMAKVFVVETLITNKFVIPTGAQRSGGTCCFFNHKPISFFNLQQIRVPHISRSLRDVGNEAALNRHLQFLR
jgi:hypothetical protein